MAFVEKYRMVFTEAIGGTGGATYTPSEWRLDILEDAFAGSITFLTGTESPVELKYSDIELYKDYIMDSELVINVVTDDSLTFSEIVTAAEDDYQVKLYKDGTLYWVGYIIPGDIELEYTSSTYQIQLRASDMLSKLESIKMTNLSSGTIAQAIASTINTNIGQSIEIIENIDLYEDGMPTGAANSPLVLGSSEDGIYRDNDSRGWTRKEQIESLLKVFNCVLFQKNAKWYLNRIPNNDGGTYTERTLTSAGAYSSNSTGVSNIVELTNYGSSQARLTNARRQFIKPIKRSEFKLRLPKVYNYVTDGYFNLWNNTSISSIWSYSGAIGTSRQILKLGHSLRITSTSTTPTNGDYIESQGQWCDEGTAFYMFLHYKFTVSGSGTAPQWAYLLYLDDGEGEQQYWNGSTWVTTAPASSDTITSSTNELNNFDEYSATITATPISGYLRMRIFEPDPNGYTFTGLDVAHITLTRTTGGYVDENVNYTGETTATTGDVFEEELNLAGRGGTQFSTILSSTNFGTITVRVNFGTISNGDSFSVDISGTTQTYTYQASPIPGVEYSDQDELLALIKGDYTNDEYSSYYVSSGGSSYDFTIRPNFLEAQTGTDYSFNYSDTSGAISKTTEVTPTGGGALLTQSTIKDLRYNDVTFGRMTDGTIEGTITDVYQKLVHNQYGAVTCRLTGDLIDYSGTHNAGSVIHDGIYLNGKYLLFTGGTYSLRDMVWNGRWQEVRTTTTSFSKGLEEVK